MTVVRELITLLGFDFDDKTLKEAEAGYTKLRNIALGVSAAVVGIGAALFGVAQSTANAASEARRSAARLGTTVEAIQELQIAAQLAGVDAESLNTALEQLGRRASEAATGNKQLGKAYADIGVHVKDASGHLKTTDVLFEEVAEKLAKIPDAGRRTQLAFELMGRGAGALVPLIRKGASGIDDLREAARATGAVLSGEQVETAHEYSLGLHIISLNLEGLVRQLGIGLLPILTEAITEIRHWFDANRAIINQKIHVAVELIGKAFAFMWKWGKEALATAKFLIEAFGGIKTIAIVLGGALGFFLVGQIGSAVLAIGKLAAAFGGLAVSELAATIYPVLIGAAFLALAALVGLVIQDIKVFYDGGDSVTGRLQKAWEQTLRVLRQPISEDDFALTKVLKAWFRLVDGIYQGVKGLAELAAEAHLQLSGGAPVEAGGDINDIANPISPITRFARRLGAGIAPGLEALSSIPGVHTDALARALRPAPAVAPTVLSPITVNVDATGSDDPDAIAAKTSVAVKNAAEAVHQRAINTAHLSLGRQGFE